ncbi:MAG: SRPBCC family protein [Erysipelothrix sp.]|nr:SRPBCC family protein [Erysipelothrix sp.]MBS3988221.1 SRPBCC family protein [Erysipelothrix sp.]
MNYQVAILVNTQLEFLGELLFDYEKMSEWQPNFDHYERVDGEYLQPGSLGKLVYIQNKQRIVMDEYIESVDLPFQCVVIYHMDGVTNRCENYFEVVKDGILWTMDVTFDFELPSSISIDQFKASTYQSMMSLKHYIESKHPMH